MAAGINSPTITPKMNFFTSPSLRFRVAMPTAGHPLKFGTARVFVYKVDVATEV
jgi:hypothetical protein